MSTDVAVDTRADSNSWLLIGGVSAVAVTYFANAGLTYSNVNKFLLAASVVLVALLIWVLLTSYEKVANFVMDKQLTALVGACIVGASLVMHGMETWQKNTLQTVKIA